ncbi:Asp23/Gls24 family envelope stress response protein [Lactococcus taiwanensis]|uniref:Asp23/Gls24 family envelope stress response protein n=1 Tax=Lactococcus taiwanensis TaxID=1151742 RepID=UPI0019642393|nr:Asp23/Gls24 family envelope stress response protein [Lactococcus taiwanensis]QRZ11218.1 Asp23/Gls24 family envelope stress response protein [Lactococcus taiwanensis]
MVQENMKPFGTMAETQTSPSDKTTPAHEINGELTYEDKVVQKIVGYALENVDGLLAVEGGFFSNLTGKLVNTDNVTSGVDVEVGKTQVAVDLKVITEYGKNVPDIYEKIKAVILKEVANMTDLDVVEVNVTVTDIKTKAEQEEDEVTVQDRVVGAAQSTGKFTSKQVDKVKDKVDDMTPEKGRVN